MFSLAQFEDHITRIEHDLPIRFKLSDGFEGVGVITSPDFSQSLMLGGLEENIDYQLFVRASHFPLSKAKEGTVISIARPNGVQGDSHLSVDLKIKQVNLSADGLLYRFTLGFAKRRVL